MDLLPVVLRIKENQKNFKAEIPPFDRLRVVSEVEPPKAGLLPFLFFPQQLLPHKKPFQSEFYIIN